MLLRTFLEIVGSGCFAAAAERPALTPSAVSGHMRRLEQIAGVGLQARTTRRLDLVFGKSAAWSGGALLWKEPLVWVYAPEHSLPVGQPLPLAVFPKPCVYRESAVTALSKTEQAWRMVFESSSMASCLSAACSGSAITVIAESQRNEGLRVLGSEEGLPELPTMRFYVFVREHSPHHRGAGRGGPPCGTTRPIWPAWVP
nr:LysR family transcriptional regulator [Pseudomonas aeruginosa]